MSGVAKQLRDRAGWETNNPAANDLLDAAREIEQLEAALALRTEYAEGLVATLKRIDFECDTHVGVHAGTPDDPALAHLPADYSFRSIRAWVKAAIGECHQLISSEPLKEMEKRKDDAYEERNRVVAALAWMAIWAGWKAGIARTAIEGWSEDWHGCAYIDFPNGQASWHYHDSHAHLFDGLPPYTGKWDGHTTPEKYERLAHVSEVLAEGHRWKSECHPASKAPFGCGIHRSALVNELRDRGDALSIEAAGFIECQSKARRWAVTWPDGRLAIRTEFPDGGWNESASESPAVISSETKEKT